MKLNAELFRQILTEYVAEGLIPVLRRREIPPSDFYEFMRTNPLYKEGYEHAQDARAELFSEEIIDIADNDFDPQRARNRIDVRRWCATKLKPNKFGDRIVHEHEGYIDVRTLLSEARNRIAAPIEVIENTPVDSTLAGQLEELLS